MSRSVLVIINPISGYARSRELPFELLRRFREEGIALDFHETTGPDDAYQYTAAHAKEHDIVLAAGGDGTVRDVVSAASPLGVPVTIFPNGTENLFAKEMGITAEIDRVFETIKWGRIIELDVAVANGKRFLMLSGVGFDAEVLLRLNSFRTGNITHLTYFWPIWRTFWEYEYPPVTVEADGKVLVENEQALVFVSSTSRYAIGLRICQHALYDDGLLDVCVYRCSGQGQLVRHAYRTLLKKHTGHKDVVYAQARHIKVSSPIPTPFETDGDPAGYLPVEYTVLDREVKILVPPG